MLNHIEDHESNTLIRKKTALKSTLISALVNILLGSAQIIIGIFSGSSGLVADGIHSFSDLISDFIVLFANHHSSKDADEGHHYGHQRYETAASLFLGLSLLVVGLAILWSAGNRIIFPIEAAQIQISALWVAIIALLSKELLFRYMLFAAEKVKSTMLVANAWHARSDAASSFLVAIGIIGSLMGYPILDLIGALIVGLMIAKTGWGFAWDALNDLMDRSVSEEEIIKIRQIITSTPKVKGCHDLKTRKMGDMILVDVHLEVDGDMSVREGHDVSSDAKNRVMAKLPVLNVMIHLDPV